MSIATELEKIKLAQISMLEASRTLERNPIVGQSAAFRDYSRWLAKADRILNQLKELRLP